MPQHKAHVIVISNEKGGTGKSTVSMHLAVKLAEEGYKVAAVDTDGRQGTLTRYIENRQRFCRDNNLHLLIPALLTVVPEENTDLIAAARTDAAAKIAALLPDFLLDFPDGAYPAFRGIVLVFIEDEPGRVI